MSVDAAFERLHGRPPSDEERARLERFRLAFDLRDNDAFWWLLLALDHYDALYARYPEQLGAEAARVLREAEASLAATMRRELGAALRTLGSRADARAPLAMVAGGARIGQHPRATLMVVAALSALLAFGGLCMGVGFAMAGRGPVPWLGADTNAGVLRRFLALILGAPAGWMMFALLLPLAYLGARSGWAASRDPLASARERALGVGLLALALVGAAACALVLAKLP